MRRSTVYSALAKFENRLGLYSTTNRRARTLFDPIEYDLLLSVKRAPNGELSTRGIASELSIGYAPAYRLIRRAMSNDLLERNSSGKNTSYRLTKDGEQKLKKIVEDIAGLRILRRLIFDVLGLREQ